MYKQALITTSAQGGSVEEWAIQMSRCFTHLPKGREGKWSAIMSCLVCTHCYDLQDHLPVKLSCSHLLCQPCALKLYSVKFCISCPVCQTVSNFNNESEFAIDQVRIAEIQNELKQAHVNCFFHEATESKQFCHKHRLPLCELCKCVQQCQLEPLLPNPRPAIYCLVTAIYDAVSSLGGPANIPRQWLDMYERCFALDITVQDLRSLYRGLLCGKNVCFVCCSRERFGLDIETLEFCCSVCFAYIRDFRPVWQISPTTTTELVNHIREKLKRLDFWLLSKSQLAWLRVPGSDLLGSVKEARSILALRPAPLSAAPVLCPACGESVHSTSDPFLRLPCANVEHAICQLCINRMKCPLDLTPFTRAQLSPYSLMTPGGGGEDTEILQGQVIRGRASEVTVSVARLRKRVGENHELANCGKPVPPFVPRSGDLFVFERYLRVLPADLQHYQSGSFQEPWYANKHSNQVEALTFRCFRTIHLCGVGIANPLEPGKDVQVDSIHFYSGNKAEGSSHLCELLRSKALVGDSVVTDLYFQVPQEVLARELYTLKVKLQGGNAQEKVAMYHGNHIGRYEDCVGTDGTGWCCERTMGVGLDEKNSGQHEFISPILRLIYR